MSENATIKKSGGEILISALLTHGVDTAFCVPGESYLAVLDALHDVQDQVKLITCRQEGGAAFMAEAYGKLTGRPGICFVTRGPGACNASIGIHTAFQDSTPLILFIGQVARDQMDREAFQEIDFRHMFGPMAKWVAQVEDAARLPEYISRAFYTAMNGRPGPVVLALPEDMLTAKVDAQATAAYQRIQVAPSKADLMRLQEQISVSERPLVILGGSGWSAQACEDIRCFIEANGLPVGTSFRCQDLFDNRHPNYVGDVGIGINPLLAERVKQADLIVALGPRLGEITTSGYTLLDVPIPKQKLIHIYSGIEELGRVYQAVLPINATMAAFAREAQSLCFGKVEKWGAWLQSGRKEYEQWIAPRPYVGEMDLPGLYQYLRETLPADAILTNGAGNYAAWLHRYYQYKTFKTQLAPTNGAMGYGVPAAVAAKCVYPKRPVIAFAGDGCFLMNGQELATAVMYRLPLVILVFNNGMYGTIRMHQEREYPERVLGTDLQNPNFATYAEACGATGVYVETLDAFIPAFEKALQSDRPTLIEIKVDPEALSPRSTLSEIRKSALARSLSG